MKVMHYTDRYFDQWENYVGRADKSTLYHRVGWKRVIEKSFGHRTHYLFVEDDGRVVGILPLVLISHPVFGRSLVSMPFLNYGGICADSDEAERLLLKEAMEITKSEDADYLELRQMQRVASDLITSEDKVTMVVRLERDPETLWNRFSSSVRQKVRKAENSGLELRVGKEENLEDFYEVFSTNMKALGSPVYSKDFFRNVLLEFPNEMLISLVTYKGKAIGGAFAGSFKRSMDGFWASSLREYFKLNPNDYLYWKHFEYACKEEFDWFNLGRSSKDSGSFRFKGKFKAEPRQLYWQYYLNKAERIPQTDPRALKYRIAAGIWKRLPLSVTKMVGPHIRKYMSQ